MQSVRPFRVEELPRPRLYEDFELPGEPLDIEIGCGAGLHPIHYCRRNPERYLIAIEHTRTRFSKFVKALEREKELENLYPIHANAISWISFFVPPESVDRYFILYPNPYPKSSQKNRRWHAMPFMSKLIETLKPGGTISLATNLQAYVNEARDYFVDEWGLSEESYLELKGLEFLGRTHFERKYLAAGESCFDLVVKKPD